MIRYDFNAENALTALRVCGAALPEVAPILQVTDICILVTSGGDLAVGVNRADPATWNAAAGKRAAYDSAQSQLGLDALFEE